MGPMDGQIDEKCCDAWPHDDADPCRWFSVLGYRGIGLDLKNDYQDLLDETFSDDFDPEIPID